MEGFLTWRLMMLRSRRLPTRPGGMQWRGLRGGRDPGGAVHRVTVAGPCGSCTRLPFDNTGVVEGSIARPCTSRPDPEGEQLQT